MKAPLTVAALLVALCSPALAESYDCTFAAKGDNADWISSTLTLRNTNAHRGTVRDKAISRAGMNSSVGSIVTNSPNKLTITWRIDDFPPGKTGLLKKSYRVLTLNGRLSVNKRTGRANITYQAAVPDFPGNSDARAVGLCKRQ